MHVVHTQCAHSAKCPLGCISIQLCGHAMITSMWKGGWGGGGATWILFTLFGHYLIRMYPGSFLDRHEKQAKMAN